MKKNSYRLLALASAITGVLWAQNPQPEVRIPAVSPVESVNAIVSPAPVIAQTDSFISFDDMNIDMSEMQASLAEIEPQIHIAIAEAKAAMNADLAKAQSEGKLWNQERAHFARDRDRDMAHNFVVAQPFLAAPMMRAWDEQSMDRGRDGSYREGTRAIDRRDYDKAIAAMNRVIETKGSHSDGAYYWKAYAQSRLGRTTDALATLGELRKNDPGSRWLNDAKALEVQVRQQSGQHVSPDSEPDEDLKLLAINSLMNSDPERAIPLLEKLLNEPKNPPRVRERALFVLARSNSPQAQSTVLRIAKGGGNPDLQMKAVQYLAVSGGKDVTGTLSEIYKSSNDVPLKRAALEGLFIAKAKDQISTIAKSEPNADLRRQSIQFLGLLGGEDVLLPLYSSESNADIKRSILDAFFAHGDAKQLIALARSEKNPELKREAVQRLSMMKSKDATDYLMELLNK